jgi:phosphate transport system ATP-binding protein
MSDPVFRLTDLTVDAGPRRLLDGISFDIPAGGVFGLMGPSGAGKSTLLKTLNRLIDLTSGHRVSGQVDFHGQPVYAAGVNPDELRMRIGILFQQPVIFPQSIFGNVVFGLRHHGGVRRSAWPAAVEEALRQAALWEEVKDRLMSPASRLSVGQQQRLCLARALATNPGVILMDEPTSALDPRGTEAIESLILRLRERHTIVLVTHNVRQARRVCDRAAFLAAEDGAGGRVLACGPCAEILDLRGIPALAAYAGEL